MLLKYIVSENVENSVLTTTVLDWHVVQLKIRFSLTLESQKKKVTEMLNHGESYSFNFLC